MGLDYKQFKKLAEEMKKAQKEFDIFLRRFLLDEALRAWTLTKSNTPVDTGLLRAMWQIGDSKNVVKADTSGSDVQYLEDADRSKGATVTSVKRQGNMLLIELYNPVEYASYVEDGHKQEVGRYVPAIGKRLKEPYVEGKHMTKLALDAIDKEIPARFKQQFKLWLESLERI